MRVVASGWARPVRAVTAERSEARDSNGVDDDAEACGVRVKERAEEKLRRNCIASRVRERVRPLKAFRYKR